MNPFTKSLATRLGQHHINEFVAHWDALEALIVRVFRAKQASANDEAEHARTRTWLLTHYADWQAALAEYWPHTKAAGAPTQRDPFDTLLSHEHAANFVANWPAMQALPAARESINRLILDLQA